MNYETQKNVSNYIKQEFAMKKENLLIQGQMNIKPHMPNTENCN